LVQAKINSQLIDLIRTSILPQQKDHWVTHILEKHESDESYGHHHNHGVNQAAKYEDEHLFLFQKFNLT
jgi:hypothetical protein